MFEIEGKIGVVCGGLSSEREISLKSGRAIYDALLKSGCHSQEIILDTENEQEVRQILEASSLSCVFIAMHGRFGEDGTLQAILEAMEIPYVGSDSLASSCAMNKITTKKIFKEYNIPTPAYQVVSINAAYEVYDQRLSFPCVVKPCAQGSSIGVSLVRSVRELDSALALAFRYNSNVLIEEYICGRK